MIRWEDFEQDTSTGLAQHADWAGFVFEVVEVRAGHAPGFIWTVRDYPDGPKLFDGRAASFQRAEEAIFASMAEFLIRTTQQFSMSVDGCDQLIDAKDAAALIRTGRVSATRSERAVRLVRASGV